MLGPKAFSTLLGLTMTFGQLSLAAPLEMESRDTATAASADTSSSIDTSINSIIAASNAGTITTNAASSKILQLLGSASPTATPQSIASIQTTLQNLNVGKNQTSIYTLVADMIEAGVAPPDIVTNINTFSAGLNSANNVNSRNPSVTIYPKKNSADAPYSLTESALRQVIQIPSTFTYGQKPPVILMPGTGDRGGINFGSNFIKLFKNVAYADPVWINPPSFCLGDAQVTAEYIAYAINYISAISGNANVSVIAWSQGTINTQWAFKYWPSTRSIVSDLIALSADFHGTIEVPILCPLPNSPCPPSLYQQKYNSNFITKLRENDGDSAYVPTTSVYSGFFDEIVEPQQGVGASAFIKDVRGVGVTNAEVTLVCAGQPAGIFNTHEGMLVNSLSYYLAVDALTHPGPGSLSRLNLAQVCATQAAPGLTVSDVLTTEGSVPIAIVNFLLGVGGTVFAEPPLMSYAT